ncbi:hypothetical protein DICPUDRAFT_81670 [Dictyostelium purpureum]|uniref:DDE Tnp4 domain-containing protein n=1 Tax=Dictyostelium purpureum TaxID=5786 RepID=F0ZU78_DICPU|nr:uncharacterized protein DICPUDRAFT_81670 [Dictyostelium purpureum]EGC32479.1 hypothetical protein DICPUDRAFT_81670 [Dictyostelium purpureum]|eukprot:XP_003290972.1 hypothetical protein DICPUDRAFT_81670 [Dictyostelium purpureum]
MNSPDLCFHGLRKRGGCTNYVGQHFYIFSEYFNSTYYCGPSCLVNHLGNISTTNWREMHKTSHSEENNPNEGEVTAEDEDGTGQDEDNGTAGDRGRNGVARGGGITRDFQLITGSHSGNSIFQLLKIPIEFFELKIKIIATATDNASNNITMSDALENFATKIASKYNPNTPFQVGVTRGRGRGRGGSTIRMRGANNIGSSAPIEERLARGHWFDKNEFIVSNSFTVFMDGNLTPTSSAPIKQYRNNMHSGKEKIECISTIGIVDGTGKFQYLSHSFQGSIPDQVSLNFLSLVDVVGLLTDDEFLVADVAFPKIGQYCKNVIFQKYPKNPK